MTEFLYRIPSRVPETVSKEVMALARLAIPRRTGRPVFVPCQPKQGAPYNMCFPLVKDHVRQYGGRMVVGWAIWEFPKVMLEAEFHGVWQAPSGNLLDLMPREHLSPSSILFLRDVNRIYQGLQVDNLWVPLSKDKDIDRFIRLQGKRFRLVNKGELKYQAEARLTGEAKLRYEMNEAEIEGICNVLCQRYGPWGLRKE